MKTPLYLVTGFLGSGKTTFLKHVLNKYAENKKIAIIQNEFAPASIDGTELKNTGNPFEILEINNGSVFCVCLLDSFVKSLSSFVSQIKPDVVFLEASGLSDPISIAQILSSKELADKVYLSQVWCIVDAVNANNLIHKNIRVDHQIRIADKIILNKTDLNETTEQLIEKIRTINPFVQIQKARYCKIDINQLFPQFQIQPLANREEINGNLESCKRPSIDSVVLKKTGLIAENSFRIFIDKFLKNTIRSKGYIHIGNNQLLHFQKTYDISETVLSASSQFISELIVLGENLNPELLQNEFKKL